MYRLLLAFLFALGVLLAVSPAGAHARHRRCYSSAYYGAPFTSSYTGYYSWHGGWSRFDHPYYHGISVGAFFPYGSGYHAPYSYGHGHHHYGHHYGHGHHGHHGNHGHHGHH